MIFRFWYIGEVINLDYYSMIGEGELLPPETENHYVDGSQNFTVNINELKEAMQIMGF
jgi:hypothetical protein